MLEMHISILVQYDHKSTLTYLTSSSYTSYSLTSTHTAHTDAQALWFIQPHSVYWIQDPIVRI